MGDKANYFVFVLSRRYSSTICTCHDIVFAFPGAGKSVANGYPGAIMRSRSSSPSVFCEFSDTQKLHLLSTRRYTRHPCKIDERVLTNIRGAGGWMGGCAWAIRSTTNAARMCAIHSWQKQLIELAMHANEAPHTFTESEVGRRNYVTSIIQFRRGNANANNEMKRQPESRRRTFFAATACKVFFSLRMYVMHVCVYA
jgi:hypothetical protein